MPATATPTTPRHSGGGGSSRFSQRPGGSRPSRSSGGHRDSGTPARGRPSTDDHEILFQKFFKSVGPRTYAAQVKRAANGNHYLVLTEGKRDDKTGEVRKTRLFVYSEDFVEFFRLVKSTAEFIKANPVSEEMRLKREKFWRRQQQQGQVVGRASHPSPRLATLATPAPTRPALPTQGAPAVAVAVAGGVKAQRMT